MEILPVSSSNSTEVIIYTSKTLPPEPRIHKDGDGDASFQLKSDSLHITTQTTKTITKRIKNSKIKKSQD
ncbi:hypothetical protein Tco_0604282 [Tanacetum coccineum]